jgi:CzcA family heavy metal efflux pump
MGAPMIGFIVQSSIKARFLVIAIAAAIMVFGGIRLHDMPVELYPEFSPPYVQVQTEALGLSAEEVEGLITIPLEADLLNGVSWVQTISSASLPGLSTITLVFEPGTDLMDARQLVAERLTQVGGLPQVSKPPVMMQPLSSTSRVMQIGLSSTDVSLIQMSVLARWTIVPRLMGVPGVANVSIWGERHRQLQVQVNPERLREKDLSLQQIIETTGNAMWVSPLTFLNASTPGTGGFIDTPNQRLGIRHELPISSASEMAEVVIDGTPLRLGDVGDVVEDHQLLIGDAIVNDEPGLLLVVEKFPWANTGEVTRGVEAALDALRPGLAGMELDPEIFRPATFIDMSHDNLTAALLIGAVLAVVVLCVLLFDWRSALISIVAISLSLVAAALVLVLLGAQTSILLLVGLVIALGIVIDDAVNDVHNILRRLREHRAAGTERSAKSTATIILEATLEQRSAISYATLIALLAIVPVFLLTGLAGAFFKPLVVSYAAAVVTSAAVALTVTVALSVFLLPRAPLERRESPLIRWLQRGYDRLLARLIQAPAPAYAITGIIVLTAVAALPALERQLVPSYRDTNLLVNWEGSPGTSRPAMNRITTKASLELRSIPGVRNVAAHVGRAVMASDEPVGINSAELWVSIDPGADYDATVTAIEEVVDAYPGLDIDVLTYPEERFNAALAEAEEGDIRVRIYGHDLDILRLKAEEVRQLLAEMDGVAEPAVEDQIEEPVVEIEVDLEKAQRYGIKPGDVRRAEAALLSGLRVGDLFEKQKVFEVVVWGTPDTRDSLTSIRELLIDTPGGGHVRLGDVADVRIVPNLNVIEREAVSRRLDIEANIRDADPIAIAAEVDRRLDEIDWPLEYHAEVLGNYAHRQAARNRLLAFAVAAAIGIFLLLQACFGSWRLATLGLLALPAAMLGGVLAAALDGGMLLLGSLAGFLAVLGIAARHGIVLIKHYQHLEQQEGASFGPQLVLRGAQEQFAPILTTAATTAVAFLPLLLFGDIAGLEIAHPMAVVVLGGLVTSTLLYLFVVPALYLSFGSNPEPEVHGRELNAA